MSTEDITQARAAFEEACLKEQAAREALEEAQRTLKDAREALWDHASSAQEWADEVRAWAEAFGKPKRS